MPEFLMPILYANLTPFLAMIFLLILVTYHPTQNMKQTRTFQFAAILEIFMIIMISCDFAVSLLGPNALVELRRFSSFCNFSLSPLIPLLLYKIFHPERSTQWLYAPFALNFVVCLLSPFNGIVFNISDVNTYGRGALFMVPFITTIFYMGILILQREFRYKRNKQIERLFLLGCVMIFALGMSLEVFFAFSFLTWDFSALCLFAYYLLLCIHSAIIDPLTGAFNRIKYYKMLASYEQKISFSIAMLDINDFKIVNDTQGHEAGDHFLIEFVSLLEHCLSSSVTIYRIGGDEFMLLSKKLKAAQLEEKVKFAKQQANKQKMDFAYGVCDYQPVDNISDLLELVDKKMYENKKITKEKA